MQAELKLPPGSTQFSRNWGLAEWKMATPHLKSRRVALDIGAHVGTTAIRYAENFERVHAFEPMWHEYLSKNTAHLNNVTTYDYAVGDKRETTMFYETNDGNSGGGSLLPALHRPYAHEVTCVTVDEFNFQEVDFIKMDVEGYELKALEGAKETLARCSPVLHLEWCVKYMREMEAKLASLNYKVVDIKGHEGVDLIAVKGD